MKKTFTHALMLLMAASGIAIAQPVNAQDEHAGHHAPAAVVATTYSTSGVVKKVDVAKGTATFAHEPIPALGWPAMTMNFGVKNKALFSKLKAGQRASIEFMQQNGENIVTAVK